MTPVLLVLSLAFAAEPSAPRAPSAIAPSLPALTREEEERIEQIVERLIRADIGRIRGPAAVEAKKEFDKLGPEAIPALIRGLNRSASNNHSCPVLLISKKLDRLLMASSDSILLEFARDEIGAGIERSPYSGTLQNLRVRCMLRKNALARLAPPPLRNIASVKTVDLARAVSSERGPRLKAVVEELGKRDGREALAGLITAASSRDRALQMLGRAMLDTNLGRMTPSSLREHFDDEASEIRGSAIRVAAAKHTVLVSRIIDRLTDASADVRAEARSALVRLAKGEDFGPPANASKDQQREAQRKWQAWWDKLSR